ncbi:838_t:CDS:2 [Diversispora eburnea]|uniref:Structure-specific endonuclease subunit SLX4 n=1 Tax=Diversispora eburnea TaxID=1213867 RepID=A0A9N9F055_9GLOM|nr:838_t:CDS:2 [Diversispora eburnea]
MERNSTQEYKFETDYQNFMKKKFFPSHEINEINDDGVTKFVANLHSEGNLTTHLSLHNRQSIEGWLTRENERKSIIIISDSEKSFLENSIQNPVIRQWHLNTCLDTLNVKEKEKPKIIKFNSNHKNYINDLINNVSQKYMHDLSHFPENLNQTYDKDLGLSWCDPINQSSSALSLKKIMEDYRIKIMDEEKNFERFISNMIKRHKEKEIKEINEKSTIKINEINEIQRHWSITDDKEISVHLEKSFNGFRIDQKPISVRSSPSESMYHEPDDGDLDNNLGILVYSPSLNFQPVKNNSVEKLKENDVITISSTDTSPANNNPITRPKKIQKEWDSPIIQSNYDTHEMDEKMEQEIEKKVESKKMPNYKRMTVIELKAFAKYGIRPSGKDIMVRQLSYIWKQMNPEESSDNGKNFKATSSSKLNFQPTSSYKSNNKSSYKNIENNIENELIEKSSCSSGSEEESDKNANSLNSFENEKKYITKSTDFPLFEKINNYIKQEPNLYCSILRYEFVELHELLEKISKAGINCTERQLQYFLDRHR